MTRLGTILSVSLTLAMSVACTDDQKKLEDPLAAKAASTQEDKHEFTVDKDGKVNFTAEIVYFEYDRADLTDDGMKRLDALAGHLKKNDKLKIRIEGHCDERGSVEYNLALGEKRAESVRKYLSNIGIGEKQLDTLSFGEEKPAEQGNGEEYWAKNRRAEFTFLPKS